MARKLFFCFAALLAVSTLPADDAGATHYYEQGRAAYDAGDYYTAAKHFEAAETEAESPVIKANSVRAQISAWRMCDLPYREFQAIEKLLTGYPEYADFVAEVKREYELGEAFYQGKREPVYWALRWIPWLVDRDRTVEIFQKALERAPFADNAPGARLRLAYLYDREGLVNKSLDELRIIIREFPDSSECKYAYLALGTGLFELSKVGDGDGRYNRESFEVFQEFLKKYPDASETGWVKRHLAEARDIQARRLYDIASYYEHAGRREASERYLAQVLRDYPDTTSANASEEMLVELDRSFVPDDFREELPSRLPRYQAYPIPVEASRLLIIPGRNNNFLQPVYSLDGPDGEPGEKAPEPVSVEEGEKK